MVKLNIDFNKITDYVAGYDINDAKKEYNLKKVIKLASNENPYKAPSGLIRFLKKELKNIYLYPDQHYKNLINTIADKVSLFPSQIFVGNGSDEILDLFFKAFIKPGDKVILFNPSFSLYKILCEIYHAGVVLIDLKDFQYNIDSILKKIKRDIKAIILCNPNNPTGTYLNQKDLQKIVAALNPKQFLCIDEAYFDYAAAKDFPDALELFKQIGEKKNLIITRTFSKIYSLAGLRIGYAFTKKEYIKALNKIRIPFNINLLGDRAVQYCLQNDSHFNKCKELNLKNKFFFYSELEKMKLSYIPSEANFILIKIPVPGKELFNKLLRKGIIIRSFDNPELKYYVRITIGTKQELKKLIKEMRCILQLY